MLIAGQSFCLSGDTGDVREDAPDGWFVADRRVLSRCEFFVNGAPIDVLGVHRAGPFESIHVGRIQPQPHLVPGAMLIRRRSLDVTLSDVLEIRNYQPEPQRCRIVLKVAADFADLFAVKDGRAAETQPVSASAGSDLRFVWHGEHHQRTTVVHVVGGAPHSVLVGRVLWDVVVEPQGTITVGAVIEHELAISDTATKSPARSVLSPRNRSMQWSTHTAHVSGASPLVERVVRTSIEDLGSLRLLDESTVDHPVIAAGAPWFMTLFGRDALLTSYMTVMFDHTIGRGSVNALARLQGDSFDDLTEEQPGRILHELRFDQAQSFSLQDGHPYYGSIDATPLFVMVVGQLMRWGALSRDELRQVLPAVDLALTWIPESGDLDGDGFVEYLVRSPHGLENQGWKDSHDGIRFGNGDIAHAPIALAEVQAYVYGAYMARAEMAETLGAADEAVIWRERASDLADRFDRAFWMDDRRGYAVGLDADKRPIDSVTSNMGHCLWTGIALPHRAQHVARVLMSDTMWSGWGIRTLSCDNPAYDPLSYHCGSVWPHDTALAAAGLARYGFEDEARTIADAIFETADHFDGRLPELLCGLGRSEVPVPVRYPTACSPQAWAAAAPLYVLQTLMGVHADLPRGVVEVAPSLPSWLTHLTISNIALGDMSMTVTIDDGELTVDGLPSTITVKQARSVR
jgi:glycogen debranching enzyme